MGIPIGPEACGVLGNAFLISIDRLLMSRGAEHVRFMDDYRCMAPDATTCNAVLGPLDAFFGAQGLSRSVRKTFVYDNPHDAIAALRDGRLASLGYWSNTDPDRAVDEFHHAWDNDVIGQPERLKTRFRRIVGRFTRTRDDYAALDIVTDPEVANIDPQLSADYLAAVGLTSATVVDSMFSRLGGAATDRTDALDLHYLRVLSKRRGAWGDAETRCFGAIAEDTGRRPPVRAWAVQAESRSDRWRQARMMERAEAEVDPLVRRSMVITLKKGGRRSRKRTAFLNHMVEKYPDLGSTARLLDAIAA